MTSFYDCSIGIGVEGTAGTFATPTRWVEFVDESLDWNKNVKQGMGMRVASKAPRSGRRVVPTADGGGDVKVEVASKGMGLWWTAAMGTGTSTLVSSATYQQVFTFGDTPSALTVQKGVPRVDGTVDAYSFLGCMVDGFEIDSPNGDIITAKFSLDAMDLTTAQSYTAASYASGTVGLAHFGQTTVSVGGTLTAPTSTVAASMSGATTVGVRSFNLNVPNNLTKDRFNYSGAGRKSQSAMGFRKPSGKITLEYDQLTFSTAMLADTATTLLLTWTGEALGTGNATFQVALPAVKLDAGLPRANNDGSVITVDYTFQVLDNLTAAQPLWLVARTADTAL